MPVTASVGTSRTLLASRMRARGQPDDERAPPRRAGHVLRAARTRCRPSPRSRRTRAPSPRRGRGSRTASGRRCRATRRAIAATPTSSSHGFDDEREHAARRPRRRRTRATRPRFTAPRRREPGRGEPHRALAVLVGAAHAVGVVVGVVDADLQRERDHAAPRPRAPPDHAVGVGAPPPRCRRAPAPPPRPACAAVPLHPHSRLAVPAPCHSHHSCSGGHGRFGNWSKSGLRFSRYAFLPSCASSVM